MDDDKIKEIAEYGIPYQWQQQMRVLNFNLTKKTVPEFINFCKCLENLKGPNNKDKKVSEMPGSKRKRNSTSSTKTNKDKKVEQEGNRYCMFHGENDTHDTEDCFALKKFIKKSKQAAPKDKNKTVYYKQRRI